MKREIKFRAWDGSRMIEFSEFAIGFKKGKKTIPYVYFKNDSFNGQVRFGNHEIMQYTGLKDKNGVEIYEGDLVQHDAWDYPFEIIFNDDHARFVCKMKTGITQAINNVNMIVIGNIHENPELIESNV